MFQGSKEAFNGRTDRVMSKQKITQLASLPYQMLPIKTSFLLYSINWKAKSSVFLGSNLILTSLLRSNWL